MVEDDERQETIEDVESPAIGLNAVLASSDWTTQTLLNQLTRGNIDLDPVFQRRDAWQPSRKSQFIESLFLGLPVPQLVLAERKEKRGTYIIIDGKQRLLTLMQFSAIQDSAFAPMVLRGLRVLPELNGLNYQTIKERPDLDEHLTSFENQPIRTVIIRAWPNENFLYTVFLRLNTGSLPLSPQELRQALHPGPFTSFINEYSSDNELLKRILRLSAPDFRMRDTELVIRYLAFRNFLAEYTGNLKPLLDRVVIYFNSAWNARSGHLNVQLAEFDNAMSVTAQIFGDTTAFRKWNGERYESNINRAVFDVMVHVFRLAPVAQAALAQPQVVIDQFKAICENNARFREAIEGTTKTIEAIYTRISLWSAALGQALEIQIAMPRMIDNRIHLA